MKTIYILLFILLICIIILSVISIVIQSNCIKNTTYNGGMMKAKSARNTIDQEAQVAVQNYNYIKKYITDICDKKIEKLEEEAMPSVEIIKKIGKMNFYKKHIDDIIQFFTREDSSVFQNREEGKNDTDPITIDNIEQEFDNSQVIQKYLSDISYKEYDENVMGYDLLDNGDLICDKKEGCNKKKGCTIMG